MGGIFLHSYKPLCRLQHTTTVLAVYDRLFALLKSLRSNLYLISKQFMDYKNIFVQYKLKTTAIITKYE